MHFSSQMAITSGCITGMLVQLLLTSSLWGQAVPRGSDAGWHFGYDLFQMLLEERGLQVVNGFPQALDAPQESVIVIAGSPPSQFSTSDWEDLVRFVQGGGTLLLAADSSFIGTGFGRFSKGPVTTSDPNLQYQGFVDCLQIPTIQDGDPLFAGVPQIVTNRSGWFAPHPLGFLEWVPIALLPKNCRPVAAQDQILLALGRPQATLDGLVIVAADASLFSNGMLWHGNAIAAIRVSEALSGSHKSQLLFVAGGAALASYRSRLPVAPSELPQTPPPENVLPEPELDKALRLANAVVKEIAESNVLNEALQQRPRNWTADQYFRSLLACMATLLVLGLVWLILASGKLQPVFLVSRRMRSALEMRSNEGAKFADFRSPAGYLAREFCFELTHSRNSADWRSYLARLISLPKPPERSEQQSLTGIVDIACRGHQAKMSRIEFQALGKSISNLRDKYRRS